MPKCNSVLQTEEDFFNPKFDQISPKIAKFLPFFWTQIHQKCLGIPWGATRKARGPWPAYSVRQARDLAFRKFIYFL